MTLLIILSHPPYDGTDVTWNALRLAETSLGMSHVVRIFVMNNAVDITRKGSKPEGAEFDLGAMLQEIETKGAQVKLCTTCITRCGISKGELINVAWSAGMKDLAEWIDQSDKVVTF